MSASQVPDTGPQQSAVTAGAPADNEAQPDDGEAPKESKGFWANAVETLQNLVTSLVTFVQSLF